MYHEHTAAAREYYVDWFFDSHSTPRSHASLLTNYHEAIDIPAEAKSVYLGNFLFLVPSCKFNFM